MFAYLSTGKQQVKESKDYRVYTSVCETKITQIDFRKLILSCVSFCVFVWMGFAVTLKTVNFSDEKVHQTWPLFSLHILQEAR